jgi:Domain of unknown function (DUF4159)
MKLITLCAVAAVGGLGSMLCFSLAAEEPEKKPAEKAEPIRMEKDKFTFVRVRYSTGARAFHPSDSPSGVRGARGSWRWRTDYPDSDVNLTARVKEVLKIEVDPDGKVLALTDPELFRYPFIYIVEPGDLAFTDAEVTALRRYLYSGGFLMLDDFWGEDEWNNMAAQLARVFPDRKFVDMSRTHPIFHGVFDISNDLNLQVPNVALGTASQYHGITWEREDAREMHIRGIFDNRKRLMVLATHNTDNGDGWEREGENAYYFREFSEKRAYPLGLNIVSYVLKH